MKEFFAAVRASFGALTQPQVDGINALLAATENLPVDYRAYVLATAWHETAKTMQPIYERGPRAYFDKYEPSTKIGKRLGNTLAGDGYRFRGRGYVQITGRSNYDRASDVTGVDLVASPDLAIDPSIAAVIIVKGMCEGWFTGKKMADYTTFQNMRRVVNGMDCAALIASHATKFKAALAA